MAEPRVFLVHLRRPRRKQAEQRDDPYYEFGSFGCTGCHQKNLLHPRHAPELEGARFGFIQGGPLGSRLVFLTPPISIKTWKDRCEALWKPVQKPFKYRNAPVIACNNSDSDFPLLEAFVRESKCSTIEGGLASRFRSKAKPLPAPMTREVITVYTRKRKAAPKSAFAAVYVDALPYDPPRIDKERKRTYERHLKELRQATNGKSKCASNRLTMSESQPGRCSRRSRA
jgi:hypothetical protein